MFSYDLKIGSEPVQLKLSRKHCLFLGLIYASLIGIILLLCAIIITLILSNSDGISHGKQEFDTEEIRATIFANIKPERISANLHAITQKPHQAGTDANKEVAEKIAEIWKENGLEDVHFLPYDVLLSYPDFKSPNHVSVLDSKGQVLFRTSGVSPDLINNDNSPKVGIQWLAYSAAGTVEGQLVYCNYGTNEGFDRLEKEFGIADLKGKIAIMRYGGMYRGDKVHNAQKRGAIGAIIYSDPAQCATNGTRPENVFPATDWMPPAGVQRGSLNEYNGDPLTPLLPSRKDFYKEKTVEQIKRENLIPSIPAVPMSYADAYQLLSRLDGAEAPEGWQGGLNITYHVGPKFRNGTGQTLRMEVKGTNEVRTIQNVIGYIWGSEFPDEWVILGNHYDAWVYGAVDPNSGTSVLAEVAKGFAQTVATTGWRPKRTLVFCAWDAEEYSLIGSTEFVEEFANVLSERAVIYLNVDLISGNQTLAVSTVPTVFRAAADASRAVRDPNAENGTETTAYDTWMQHHPPRTDWLPDIPHMPIVGSGSDEWNFLNQLGIPVVDFRYHRVDRGGYPLYHTRYEVPYLNEHIFDHQNLAVHKTTGEYWAELARYFADSPLLPFNATIFARTILTDYVAKLEEPIDKLNSNFSEEMAPAKKQFDALVANAKQFLDQAMEFEKLQLDSPSKIGWANRRLRKLDRCFINPVMGMAKQESDQRHVLYSLSTEDKYASSVLAAVHQKIAQLSNPAEPKERLKLGNALALELTVLQQAILCAINTLKSAI